MTVADSRQPPSPTQSIWQTLAQAPQDQGFFGAWLKHLVTSVGQVREAVLIWGPANTGPFSPAAFWPAQTVCSQALAALCEQALELRLGLTRSGEVSAIVQPIVFEDEILGVIAIRFTGARWPENAQETLGQCLGWLALRRQEDGSHQQLFRERLLTSLDLLVAGLDEQHGDAAAQNIATELAVKLNCDRVAIGFGDKRRLRIAALSHSAEFSRRLELGQALEAAMNEAADQGQPIHFSLHATESLPTHVIQLQHKALSEKYGNGVILSVPVYFNERELAVFLFEWSQAVHDPLLEQLAYGLPPVLARLLNDKRRADRGIFRLFADSLAVQMRHLFGPRHAKNKLIALCLLGFGLFCYFASGDFRISAEAELEGRARQIVASPFDGFVSESAARAGQQVKRGDLLALLDDRDMRLETSRWASQEAQYVKQSHDAEAQHNLAQLQISRAQAQQAEAQRALSDAMAGRAKVLAPIDGVITLGDLSQQLGSAVKKGQTLFELSPLDSYRIVIKVDEHDIAYLSEGQKGHLLLTALPGLNFTYTVTMITPVAEAKEGKNFFRVEANLDQPMAQLRPGMEGIAKTQVGQQRLIWIWTRPFMDWLKLQSWYWLGL